MGLPKYSIGKLLPLVILSSAFSALIVYSFRYIAHHPLYLEIAQLSHPIVAPLLGSILLIILFYLFAKHLKSGLPHVVLEFHLGLGRLPLLNLLFQYLTASIALLMGFTIGAIGPAVHIGAGSANAVGRLFRVRHHTLQVLTACGSAVAITLMLGTPLMAIIFTYETIIRQFRWRTLTLVSAASLFAQWFSYQLGISPILIDVLPFTLSPQLLLEMILFGVLCGLVSSGFLNVIDLLIQKVGLSYWKKLLLAGGLTSLVAWLSPDSVGLGYELIKNLLYQPQTLSIVSVYLILRFISSSAVLALAVPGGALGPSLILGALTGAIFAQLFQFSDQQVFIIVGMGVLLGAVLHVPLAGILFVLESTNDIRFLLPCIIASYSAYFIHQRLSRENNLIELLLARQNITLRNSPSLKKKRLISPL